MEGSCLIERLPEECLSHVLSLTSPRDACRSAVVSPAFHTAADSDTVWKRFLPSDHQEIVSRAANPVVYASLKELYFILCDSVLIDGGRKVFGVERDSGAKWYTICARDLGIAWWDDEQYWTWDSHPDSRFAEVAILRFVCWLDICGRIDCRELSVKTTYKAYLIFKLAPGSSGLGAGSTPQEVSVRVGAQTFQGAVCIGWNLQSGREVPVPPGVRVPCARSDGWMEIEMGEFVNEDGGDGEVSMRLREVEVLEGKKGLIVEGIQVRPALLFENQQLAA